jgi:hypothetical protein
VVRTNLTELALTDTVAVEDDPLWFKTRVSIEGFQEVDGHRGQVDDDLLTVFLYAGTTLVLARVPIHGGHQLEVNERSDVNNDVTEVNTTSSKNSRKNHCIKKKRAHFLRKYKL